MLSKWLSVYHSRGMIDVAPCEHLYKRNSTPGRAVTIDYYWLFTKCWRMPSELLRAQGDIWKLLVFFICFFSLDHQSKTRGYSVSIQLQQGFFFFFFSLNYIQQLSILQLSIFILITVVKQMKKLIGCFCGCKSSQWNASSFLCEIQKVMLMSLIWLRSSHVVCWIHIFGKLAACFVSAALRQRFPSFHLQTGGNCFQNQTEDTALESKKLPEEQQVGTAFIYMEIIVQHFTCLVGNFSLFVFGPTRHNRPVRGTSGCKRWDFSASANQMKTTH